MRRSFVLFVVVIVAFLIVSAKPRSFNTKDVAPEVEVNPPEKEEGLISTLKDDDGNAILDENGGHKWIVKYLDGSYTYTGSG